MVFLENNIKVKKTIIHPDKNTHFSQITVFIHHFLNLYMYLKINQ